MNPEYAPGLLALVIAAAAAGFFVSLLSGALDWTSRNQLQSAVGDPALFQRLDQLLDREDALYARLIALGVLVRTVVVLGLPLWLHVRGGGALELALGFVLALLLLIGPLGIWPEEIGRRRAIGVMRRLLIPAWWLLTPVALVAGPFHWLSSALLDRVGLPHEAPTVDTVADEILDVMDEAQRDGVIEDPRAQDMIESVVELAGSQVREIMTPRTEMVAVPADGPLREVLAGVGQRLPSRIPVFEKTRDRILGVLYLKDIIRQTPEALDRLTPRKLMRPPVFVPETKKVGVLLREFQEQQIHMAIVLDEYGGTAGLVTIEDILEEIVGEIQDEYDPAQELAPMESVDPDTVRVDARVHVDELNEVLGLDLPEDEAYETVGGFVFSALGKVPSVGDSLAHGRAKLKVLEADERRVRRLEVQRVREPEREG